MVGMYLEGRRRELELRFPTLIELARRQPDNGALTALIESFTEKYPPLRGVRWKKKAT